MKEWNKPELLSLGIENTFTDEETISNGGNGGQHYCHASGTPVLHGNGCGHSHAGNCDLEEHEKWNTAHHASCCCVGQS